MGGIILLKKALASAIILLFILTSVTPMVVGFDTEIKEKDELLANLAFVCSDRYGGSSKLEYYEEYLLQREDSEDVESEEEIRFVKTPQTSVSLGPMDSAWPMKCHDLHHTGRSLYSTADNDGTEKWRYETDRWIEGGAIMGENNIIYFGDFDGNINALYPNGTLKWKYVTSGKIWSTPALSNDGIIYIGSYDNWLYALYTNGTLKWKFDSGASISSSPAIGEDGTVYFGNMGTPNSGCRIFAINSNGTEKWHYNTGYKIVSDPAIEDDGTIYIGSGDKYLYALNPNGTLRWRFKTGNEIHSHPSISQDGTVYICSNDDYLYAIYPNGTLKWMFNLGSVNSASASIGIDGTIYVTNGNLYAIYPNGTLKWEFDFGDKRWVSHSSPAISGDGTIYIGTHIDVNSGGEIIAVNFNGTEKWRSKIANMWVESSPCIGEDGTVYIGSSSEDNHGHSYGYLYAFGSGNNPPNNPLINGPKTGYIDTVYNYTFITEDPEKDDIYYYVDWGDGQVEEWIGPYNSGEEVIFDHSWTEQGGYTIGVKAKDIYDAESDWATLEVSMPKNKPYFMNWLFERYPLLERLFYHYQNI